MDISRETKQKGKAKRYWPAYAVAGVVLAGFIATKSFGSASHIVDRESLVIGDVKRGDFAVQIRGIGTLVPKNIQWLAANVEGRVDTILVESGARVRKGDVIARLSNPQLHEKLAESQWELEAQLKENRAAQLALESELASLRAEANNAEVEYRSAKLRLDAERKLVDQGIVSKITVEQSRLAVDGHRDRIRTFKERMAKMHANLAATVDAHAARINKMQKTQNLIRQQIDDLTVRASIDGVVQEMPLKLGQQVVAGTEAAKIAPHDNLVALLDVQDFQVRDIALGQSVRIDTRSSKINGKVVRIDPSATNGVVKVEVALAGKMPPDARPNLSVEGVIDVEQKRDVLFVRRPSFAQSHSKVALYRVASDDDTASRVPVEFGRASTLDIEVRRGLKEGDRIILSDASAWESHDNIEIR
jgi:HlyD family secretion protein